MKKRNRSKSGYGQEDSSHSNSSPDSSHEDPYYASSPYEGAGYEDKYRLNLRGRPKSGKKTHASKLSKNLNKFNRHKQFSSTH